MMELIENRIFVQIRCRVEFIRRRAGLIMLLMGAMLVSGCSNLRYLEEGQELYTGSEVTIESEKRIPEKSRLESELKRVMRPQPNATFLGMRPRLWFYNIAGEPTGRGLRYFLRNRIGRPPVLFEDVDPARTTRLIENRLVNLGYFDAAVSFDVLRKNQRAWVDYNVNVRKPYTFATLYPVEGSDSLAIIINESLEETLIREDAPYRLEVLKDERVRIDEVLKERGFFYFQPEMILFRADTTAGERTVDIFTTIKPDVPAMAKRQFRIANVFIYADYLVDGMDTSNRTDTITLDDGIYLFDSKEQYRERIIDESIFMRPGKFYNVDDHNRTLNYLTSLRVFRFVNIRFVQNDSGDEPALDVRILLTPMDRKSISAEVRGITKSNNFAGPGLTGSFTNRNFLGGAEDFRFSLNASYETLIGQREVSAHVWEAGGETELTFPRFVLPPFIRRPVRVFSPKTSITLSGNYLSRSDAFDLTTFSLKYGYTWNRTIALQHRLNPLVINVYSLGRVHEDAQGQFIDNVLLRQDLFEQFILGAEYSFFYNSLLKGRSRNDYYFNLNLDASGNLASLVTNHIAGGDPQEGLTLFGQSFAQYFKPDFDARYYRQLGQDVRMATRLIAGVGIPYGNSRYLPYLKQFTIGGSNSLRAFHPRSLGPGAYQPPDTLVGRFNIHQSGEIILEANLEFRFDHTSVFKTALFVDAGNVWRLCEDENVPGGKFSWDSFLEQMGLGAGFGVRLDVNFFVLRFDFAVPLAVPFQDDDGFFQPIHPFRGRWWADNLRFNLGIGYPF
jgi:outer membrane protein insertion porin family